MRDILTSVQRGTGVSHQTARKMAPTAASSRPKREVKKPVPFRIKSARVKKGDELKLSHALQEKYGEVRSEVDNSCGDDRKFHIFHREHHHSSAM